MPIAQLQLLPAHTKKGFTIVEVLISIFILSMAVTAAMVLVQQGLRTTFNARDQITAFYLAQDAIEQIHAIHFTNRLQESPNHDGTIPGQPNYWLSGLDGTGSNLCVSPNGAAHCRINNFKDFLSTLTYNGEILSCASSPCTEVMQYMPDYGIYGYEPVAPPVSINSSFVRDIAIRTPTLQPTSCVGGTPGTFPCTPDLDSAEVKVTVSWRGLGRVNSVTLVEYLRNY